MVSGHKFLEACLSAPLSMDNSCGVVSYGSNFIAPAAFDEKPRMPPACESAVRGANKLHVLLNKRTTSKGNYQCALFRLFCCWLPSRSRAVTERIQTAI